MRLLSLLGLGLLFAASLVDATEQQPEVDTFVIVHGATGGGWDWRVVSEHLIEAGHRAYRPTLTGLGERFHLAGPEVNLDTHIQDIVSMIEFEGLDDVVLVGHSYGGMVITGVMNRIPERIKHATYLDALLPDHGMTAEQTTKLPIHTWPVEAGVVKFPWVDESKPFPRDVVHPVNTLTQPVEFDNPLAHIIAATFVAFIPNGQTLQQWQAERSGWSRAKKRGWTMRIFDGDHVVYRAKPAAMANLLIATVSDRNSSAHGRTNNPVDISE
ncbi:hypothetical protein GCM10008090_31440 [Arenicella chitinivorans]|uniref:AB hydrolase-1 domain-containing protein n=1 Tax=Arenicella chitinivorans TaxID=1329800 RepID=A0A918S3U6_9GAMM|nr:alpha/beta fold hydrolase [Arenicella chitinivorans]GHA19320.1 hypothetical protein GCM10008090_31440 [Arenicella chitinivorans]